ncbi:DUF3367 domain-containing protein [Paraconexibacter antarcticus]|uniref:DUF3367 domain-containing protein n=1 Tax=Paraconexibacter antarcticus TaxID=2949664 RepID=A0ABY5DNJ0_9ACTN|nr:alpha-(1->3)-arabinofuranosyltransferase family protein [Paraconexibacter antarcticus]UTI62489.1 DUF3367 domain-containing protein [Paraconexibacter antarcticus]
MAAPTHPRTPRGRFHPPRPDRALSLALVVLAYAVAFGQRWGETIADTKLALYVAPHRFLTDVLRVWSPTGDLGHVWGGQYNGYAFPMAPWFALGDTLGLPVWVVHRLWLGTLLALAALGVATLLRTLAALPRAAVAVPATAAVLYVLCPYVAVLMDRTSISLLTYAALPWMLLAVHRGLRDPRGWCWPAVGALLLACAGGGVNAAVIGWVLVGPLLLVGYELAWGGVDRAALRPWLTRLVPCIAVANAWWVVPLAVHARYGLDFLPFTEQPGTIWSTTSLTESLRGMGFWTSYVGVGSGGVLRPYATHGGVLLTALPVVLAGLAVPALALGGLRWTHRARYAPFLLLLVLTGLLVMGVGWPEGTPLRRASTFTYNHLAVVRVLRTTYKAGPLLTLGLAGLGGLAAGAAWTWLRARRRPVRLAVPALAAVLVAVAAWPLVRGAAPDEQLHIEVPARWHALAARLGTRPPTSRALVLPGQLFASYRWGQTIDAILPSLTDHPVATRNIVPYGDRRAVELQWAVDDLVSQERVLPGQLPSLLDLLGVGDVVVAADGDRSRSGELGPLETADTLASEPALRGGRAIGAETTLARMAAGRIAPARRVPLLRDVPVRTGGIVRVIPRGPVTLFDGGARALTNLAAFGRLEPDRPYRAGADLSVAQARAAARGGAPVVVADGDRRQAFVSSRLRGGTGQVLRAGRSVSRDGTLLDPYEAALGRRPAADAQTVQVLAGVRDISAPFSPQVTQFPEHRPAAAMDGDPSTSWLADRFLDPGRAVLTVDLGRRLDVPRLRLWPASDSRGVVTAVAVNGRRFAVHRGWNTLAVGLKRATVVQVAITGVRRPRHASAGLGGIRELQIPGVRVREALRVPDVLERDLRPADLAASPLTYLLERLTAAAPARQGRLAGPAQAGLVRDARDPERQLHRVIAPPVARRYAVSAWARVDVGTSDAALDRLAGVRGGLVADGSARFDGLPRYRASGAFDGDATPAGRAWVGQWIPGHAAFLRWTTPAPLTLRRLRVVPVRGLQVRRATRVRLSVDGRRGAALAVPANGLVTLPRAVRGRAFRLDVLAAQFAPGVPARVRMRRAVGIAELRAAGLPRLRVPRSGRVPLRCGAASIIVRPWVGGAGARPAAGAVRARLGGRVSLRALDAGRPVRLDGCGTVLIGAGPHEVSGATGALVADTLSLTALAPGGVLTIPGPGGHVVDAGHADGSGLSGLRVTAGGPSWLVLGESYSRGWRAECDGRDLGAPVPLQGYANGWPLAAPGCRTLDLRFGPEGTVRAALWLSGLGGALMLVLLGRGVLARRRREAAASARGADGPGAAAAPAPFADLPAPPPLRLSARQALAAGVVLALVVGFVFALRAGAVAGPLAALLLWRGATVRALVTAAGALLLGAVPAIYAAKVALDGRGLPFDTTYATDRLAAHWVAVTAYVLLALAAGRLLAGARPGGPLSTARSRPGDPAAGPAGRGALGSAP